MAPTACLSVLVSWWSELVLVIGWRELAVAASLSLLVPWWLLEEQVE